jgi:hypothetical protein
MPFLPSADLFELPRLSDEIEIYGIGAKQRHHDGHSKRRQCVCGACTAAAKALVSSPAFTSGQADPISSTIDLALSGGNDNGNKQLRSMPHARVSTQGPTSYCGACRGLAENGASATPMPPVNSLKKQAGRVRGQPRSKGSAIFVGKSWAVCS